MSSPPSGILVTDFDGTLTRKDYYQVFCERYLPNGIADIWERYRAGHIDHFEAMRSIFAAVAPGEAALLDMTRETGLEPELPRCLDELRAAGWGVVVVSAGCGWYIDHILRGAGVELTVHTNPGEVREGRLEMRRPERSPFSSSYAGVDKAAVVRWAQQEGRMAAYAGDGLLDLEAALQVPPQYRFARADLAQALSKKGEPFQPFERWRDVARALCRVSGVQTTMAGGIE